MADLPDRSCGRPDCPVPAMTTELARVTELEKRLDVIREAKLVIDEFEAKIDTQTYEHRRKYEYDMPDGDEMHIVITAGDERKFGTALKTITRALGGYSEPLRTELERLRQQVEMLTVAAATHVRIAKVREEGYAKSRATVERLRSKLASIATMAAPRNGGRTIDDIRRDFDAVCSVARAALGADNPRADAEPSTVPAIPGVPETEGRTAGSIPATGATTAGTEITEADVEAMARAIYELDPFDEGGEFVDGFQVSPGGALTWEQALARDAEFGDAPAIGRITEFPFKAARAALTVSQQRLRKAAAAQTAETAHA